MSFADLIIRFTSLHHLNLTGSVGLLSGPGLVEIASHCTQLRKLDLRASILKDEDFTILDRLSSSLEELSIEDATDLGPLGMRTIWGLTGLQSLQLTIWNRLEGCLSFEGQLQQLVCLRFREADFSDRELQAIAGKCPHLEELGLYRCYEISDAGMVGVFNCCKSLQTIELSYIGWDIFVFIFTI